MFQKASKKKSKLRLAIEGASGSGKTYSSLILAKSLGKKVAVIDTEHGSASLYSDIFDFDVLELHPPYEPEKYIEAIETAERAGYEVLVIDSISHEWNGKGGCLELHEKLGGNSYTAWAKITPRHDNFINTILRSPMHIIATMRSKANYETSKDNKTGKMIVEKKGTSPIQRDSVDYEFTIVFDLNKNHVATASKDRSGLFDNKDFTIDESIGKKILDWLTTGEEDLHIQVKNRILTLVEGDEEMARQCLAEITKGAVNEFNDLVGKDNFSKKILQLLDDKERKKTEKLEAIG